MADVNPEDYGAVPVTEEAPAPNDGPNPEDYGAIPMGQSMTASDPNHLYRLSDEGMRSVGMRTKLGFAEGPKEKLDILNNNGIEAFMDAGVIYYKDPKTKTFSQIDENAFSVYDIVDLLGDAPEFAGMTGGGILGTAAGVKDAGITGRNPLTMGAVGAALGGAIGSSIKTNMARLFGAEVSTKEELERIKGAGISGAIADPTGKFVAKAVQKVLAPVANKLVKTYLDANTVLGKYKDANGRPLQLLPDQGTDSRMVATLQGIAEGSFLGGNSLRVVKQAQEKALDDAVVSLVQNVGRGQYTKEEMGVLVQDAIFKRGQTFRTLESKVWGEVDKLLPDAHPVDVDPIRKWAADMLLKSAPARSAAPSVSGAQANKAVDILTDMASLPDRVSFTTAHEWISSLSAMTRKEGANAVLNSKEAGIIKDLTRRLNMVVDDSGKTLKGQKLLDAFKQARGFSKEWNEVFNTKLVKTLVNAEPQKVAQILVKPNQMMSIRAARQAMGAESFQKVKGAWVGELLHPSSEIELAGASMVKRLAKYDEATLKEIFNRPNELKEFRQLASAIEASHSKAVKGGTPGRVAIQLTQPGAMLQLGGAALGAGGAQTGSATAITGAAVLVLGPAVLGKVMSHPMGVKWLTQGFKAPKGTEAATKATAAIIAIAYEGTKGMPPDGLKLISQEEADRHIAQAAKLRPIQGAIEQYKSAIPTAPGQPEPADQIKAAVGYLPNIPRHALAEEEDMWN